MTQVFRFWNFMIWALFIINISFYVECSVQHPTIIPLRRYKREELKVEKEPPQTIKINIIDAGNTETFEVTQVLDNYLVNQNLSVFQVGTEKGKEYDTKINHKSLSESLNKGWYLYQNYDTKCAVVFFRGAKALNGIIGKKYLLSYVEYDGIANYINVTNATKDTTISKRKRELGGFFNKAIDSDLNKIFRRSTELPEEKKNPQFYLESLVLIAEKVLDTRITDPLIMKIITIFNIIDMLMSATNFKINIAGLLYRVTTDDRDYFPFVKGTNNNLLDVHKVLTGTLPALEYYKGQLPKNYDCVIYLNSRNLQDEKTNQPVNAFLSYPLKGINKAKLDKCSNHSHPLLVARSALNWTSIITTTRQIFHLIGGLNYVEKYVSSSNETFNNCTSVPINDFNSTCLSSCFKWTEDYCAFSNKPRSLYGKNNKVELISRDMQCWCHNYDYYYDNNNNITDSDICKGFQCNTDTPVRGTNVINITMVMDGTPCGTNKVCWTGNCEDIN